MRRCDGQYRADDASLCNCKIKESQTHVSDRLRRITDIRIFRSKQLRDLNLFKMISFKKSYAEQLLQLVLTLSLLQVDPDTYLGRGWDHHLEMRHGNGWELEMLRAVPVTDYPYANRKAVIPLIEDLVRFDRHSHGMNDVTAYLLNVQNSQNNQTAGGQESDSGGVSGAVAVELPPVTTAPAPPNITTELDLFLNFDNFADQMPIMEQNLADLREYGDIPLTSFPYYGLPLKDEPPEAVPFDFQLKYEQPSTSSGSTHGGSFFDPDLNSLRTNDSEQHPDNGGSEVKKEEDEDEYVPPALGAEVTVKKEEIDDETDTNSTADTFYSPVELTEEESEIVEVLWKQDVDLGFSLAPPKPDKPAAEAGSSKCSEDEAEKLKALQDLKDDKSKDENSPKDDLNDEWAGIPFTIDNETGEYIRLPLQLDELLQDVLQLADLNSDDQESQPQTEKSNELKSASDEKSPHNEQASTSAASSNGSASTSAASINDPSSIENPPQSEVEISSVPSDLFNLDNAGTLDELDMMIQSAGSFQHHRPGQNYGSNSAFRQSGFHHHHHHQSRVPLTRGVSMEQRLQDIANLFNPLPAMGVGMGVSEMSPYSHYPTHYPYQGAPAIPQHGQFPHPTHHPVLHNASLADLGASQPHYGHNLGSAVSSSMHLTNSSHETDSAASGYKMEHDMMYYSNTSSELNHTTDGFINSILNDEDLQLMDMGVNESFCTMRMLEGNTTSNNSSVLGSNGASHNSHMLSMPTNLANLSSEVIGASTGDRLDASSDSAVSSMGSERVPSLSDGEWGDAGSDSAQDYHQGKYGGPYDYSYNGRLGGDSARQQPVAQKKHQMFGKRFFQEQPNIPPLSQPSSTTQPPSDHLPPVPVKYEYDAYGMHPSGAAAIASSLEGAVGPMVHKDHVPLMTNAEMKYACSLDFARPPRGSGNPAHDLINHNHTYTLPQGSGSAPRPQIRDKKLKRAEDEHMTRDEKRARALNIPIAVTDIINLPMDEFNERLSKYDLNETQLTLIRDIRRRGKNKVAAQNCRKRKLDQILSLEDEVKEVRRRKDRLFHDREIVLAERKRIASKFATLHRHVFQYLRDSDGNPCSPSQYSLQQAADGSVYLLRRENNKPENNTTTNHSGHHHSSSQGPSPPSSSSSSQHPKD